MVTPSYGLGLMMGIADMSAPTANDNGRTYWVLFFSGPEPDAHCVDRHGPFASEADAVGHSLAAYAIAKRDGLSWSPTEISCE